MTVSARPRAEIFPYMKFFKFILFAVFSFLTVLVVGGYIFISLYGQRIVEEEFSRALNRKVTTEDVRLIFPFGLHVKNIEAERTFKARSVRAHLILPFLAGERLVFSRLVLTQPVFYVYRDESGKMVWRHPEKEEVPEETSRRTAGKAKEAPRKEQPFFLAERDWAFLVDYLEVAEGKVEYWDFSQKKAFHLTAQDIVLKARNIYYPVYDENIKFDFAGRMAGDNILFSEAAVKARGWVNFASKGMDVKFELEDKQAGLQLSETAVAVDDQMKVEGRAFIQRPRDIDLSLVPEDSLQAFLLKNLRMTGLTMTVHHSFETTMSRFEIEKMKIWGDVGYQGEDKKTAAKALKEELQDLGKQVGEIGRKIYDPAGAEKPKELPPAETNRTAPPKESPAP